MAEEMEIDDSLYRYGEGNKRLDLFPGLCTVASVICLETVQ